MKSILIHSTIISDPWSKIFMLSNLNQYCQRHLTILTTCPYLIRIAQYALLILDLILLSVSKKISNIRETNLRSGNYSNCKVQAAVSKKQSGNWPNRITWYRNRISKINYQSKLLQSNRFSYSSWLFPIE